MRKYVIAIAVVIVFLAIFIPFASSSPDGLERVAETLGIKQSASFWKGIMKDYSVSLVGNPYLSTLLAGIFGVLLVIVFSLALGKAVTGKKAVAHQ